MIMDGILIVDDAAVKINGSIDPNTTRVKGHKITAFLLSLGLSNFIRPYPCGTQLWIDMDKVTLEKILEELKR